jgi:hypothetical protein
MNQPKLTIKTGETPTAQIIAQGAPEYSTKDARGRVFTIKKPGLLAQYRIVEVMGKSADIQTYRQMVTPLIYIVGIDDDPITPPTNKMQLEALIQRIGEDGLKAVSECLEEHFGEKSDPEADKEAIKK